MNQYDYINDSNFEDKIYINNNIQITDEINQSISIKLSEFVQDIFTLINFIRTNPIDYCNNLIHKATNKKKQEISKIIQYLEDVHRKEILLPYKKVPEISDAARNLLNNLSHHYKINRNLNLKELDPSCLNLKTRLSNYGERTGRIFETVLIKMDNPEDIINHILMEEKGRNMLLSYKMKYIGIACALFPSNLLCSVVDIVQDFVPFKNKNTLSTNFLNSSNNKTNNNISFFQKSHDNNSYIKDRKKYKTNSEPVSLIDNLNYKNSKDNLKLNIVIPKHKQNDEKKNIEIKNDFNDKNSIENKNRIIKKNENESCDNNKQKNNLEKNEPYKSPKKINQPQINKKKFVQISPISESSNTIINKTTFPKRNNSNIIIKKEQNTIKDNNNGSNENIDTIKFTIAGRINNQQREIEEISKKNLIKSNSVCSFNLNSHNFKSNNKNKFQRLNHEEKMEILHKINQRNNKTPNSNSPREKNSGNPPPLTQSGNTPDYFSQNNSRKSPSRSTFNQDNFDIYSENDKINFYNNNIVKSNNNADRESQTFTEIQSNKGIENNEEYSRKKINEIKNDLLYFKNQLKNELRKEVREEVREEIKNEFNKKILYQNQRQPIIINIDRDYNNQTKKSFKNYYDDRDKRNSYDGNNEIYEKIFYHPNKSNSCYYFNKNKGKNRWSSVQKYYYIKNNNNNINNINNTNIYFPDNESQFSQNSFNFPKERKSLDIKNLINNKNFNNGISLKEKYKEQYEQLNNINNNINDNNLDNHEVISRVSYKKDDIKKDSNNAGDNNMDHSYFNGGNKARNRQEIKKLIKLYNIVKDDQRNKTIFDNNNINIDDYNYNKSFTNYYLIHNNQSKDNINENNENYNISEKFIQNNDIINKSNEIKNNNKINYSINHYKEKSDINEFIKGNRILNYEKFESKRLMDYSEIISKPRNKSVRNINNINNEKFIDDININVNKSEDLLNLDNKDNTGNNNKKEEIQFINNNNGKEYVVENTIYNKNNKAYNSKDNKDKMNNDINLSANYKDKNDKLSLTGRFIEETNNINNVENNNILKNQEKLDILNDSNKIINNEYKKEQPIISKSVKFEKNRTVNSVKANKRELDLQNEKEKNADLEKRKVQKLHSDLIKEYQNLDKIDNNFYFNLNLKSNDSKSNDIDQYNLYSNMIKTKKVKFGGIKDYERNLYINKNNNYSNLLNIQKGYLYEKNHLDNYQKISPRLNKNLTTKATSYYKKKKFVPYTYHPKEYKLNYNDYSKNKDIIDKNKNESLEKKYIKDPEGNIIETHVKKTKYNDGSVLLEYA